MSKKIFTLIAVVVALLLAYVATAWYCGKSYETQSQQDIQKLNQLLQQTLSQSNWPTDVQFRVSQLDLKRGIFSSKAHYQLSLVGQAESIPVVAHIQHGPFIGLHPARYQATYELENVPQTNLLFKLTEGKSPLTVSVRESFTRAVALKASMPPINFSQNGAQTVFSGLTMEADSDHDFSFFKGDLKMDNLSLLQGFNKFDVVKVRSDFDLKSNGSYFIGKTDAKIDSITYGGLLDVLLKDITLESDSKDVGKLNASELVFDIAQINVGKQDFGSVKLGTKIDNFDMLAYQKLLENIQQNNQDKIEAPLQALLATKPVLTVAPVEWKTGAGVSSSSLAIHFKAAPADQKPLQQSDWQDWIEKSAFKADLSKAMLVDTAAKAMQISGMDAATAAEQARALIEDGMERWLANGLIKDAGKNYSSDIRFENGMFNVNGKAMTPAEFEQLSNPAQSVATETPDSVVGEGELVPEQETPVAPPVAQ